MYTKNDTIVIGLLYVLICAPLVGTHQVHWPLQPRCVGVCQSWYKKHKQQYFVLNCLNLEHPCCIQCFNMTPWENLIMLNRGHLTLYRRFPNRWIGRACPVIWPIKAHGFFSVEAILKTMISLVSSLNFVISSGYISIILLNYMWPFWMILYLVLYSAFKKIKKIILLVHLNFIFGRFYIPYLLLFFFLLYF